MSVRLTNENYPPETRKEMSVRPTMGRVPHVEIEKPRLHPREQTSVSHFDEGPLSRHSFSSA
jgi:hypothetical protein